MFLMGCGRMFEGTPSMFTESLRKVRALDAQLRVYCAHEYTVREGRGDRRGGEIGGEGR